MTLALLHSIPARAVADEPLPEASRTFEYQTPPTQHYWRAALEEVGLFGAGLGYYFLEQKANSIDWALNYDWLSFRQKLTCEACDFDQNFFDTNFVTHPAAGTLYYLAARGNRLNVLESFAYAATMSTLWEFLGEFRERVSVNDLFVTPISGLALGESTTQLGAFFDRSCGTPLNQVLGDLFGPSKSLHDAIDGARPARTTDCDERGLDRGGAHRFRLWAGAASVWNDRRPAPSNQVRFGLDTTIAHLDSANHAGRGWLAFSDGNVSSLEARVAVEDANIADLRVGARVVPAGLHYRDLYQGAGSSTVGHELLLGLLVETEYALHRPAGPGRTFDRVFLIEAPASALGWTLHTSALVLELSLDAGATLAGVTTFALPEYQARHSAADLASVTKMQGYSHALGFALAPRLRLQLEGAALGVQARSDRFFAVRVLDPLRDAHGMTPIFDTRRRAEVWVSVGPPGGGPRATFFLDGYQRSGTAGDATYAERELAAGGSLDAVF